MILKGLTWLVVLQLLGSVIHLSLLPALPGPIIGMVLLFALLLLRRGIPEPLEKTAALLLQYLPLLLIVPAAGIMTSLAPTTIKALKRRMNTWPSASTPSTQPTQHSLHPASPALPPPSQPTIPPLLQPCF